jgi:hypothetical protein
VDLSREEDELD